MGATEAGREMDREIAVRVFGQTVRVADSFTHGIGAGESFVAGSGVIDIDDETVPRAQGEEIVPHYSTDIGAAWAIVEHYMGRGWNWDIAVIGGREDTTPHRVTLYHWGGESIDADYEADTTSTPLGICRCALAATARKAGG